jgi:hypothetical protein
MRRGTEDDYRGRRGWSAPGDDAQRVDEAERRVPRGGDLIIRPMGLRALLGRVGCKLLGHGGEWEWVADGSCVAVRSCPYCGEAGSLTQHSFTGWVYASPADTTVCLMEQRCTRCQLSREKVRHKRRAEYLTPGKCEMQSSCTRCGKTTSEVEVHHKDPQWRYLYELEPPSGLTVAPLLGGFGRPAEACRGRMTCSRCSAATSPITTKHQWGAWKRETPARPAPTAPEQASQVRRCLLCNLTESKTPS